MRKARNALIGAAVAGLMLVGSAGLVSARAGHEHGYGHGYHEHAHEHHGHARGLPLHAIKRMLRHRNYRRIRVRDAHLPVYKFKACRNGKRYLIWTNRWGRIIDRHRRGYCVGSHHHPHAHGHGPAYSFTLRF